jgi:transcriptional regulator with XRE-family HTH domain
MRKDSGLAQQALADLVQLHISPIRRYESGQSQPTLDAIRKFAVALSLSADMLLSAHDERGAGERSERLIEFLKTLKSTLLRNVHASHGFLVIFHFAYLDTFQ